MGAGNPLVSSFNDEKFKVVTFFGDFNDWDTDTDEYRKQYKENNEGDEISEDTALIMKAEECEENFYNALSNAVYAAKDWKWNGIGSNRKDIDTLSGEFRGSGMILAETDSTFLVVPTSCEHYHIAFGIVPNIEWGVMWDEIYYDEQDKIDWYISRRKDFDTRIDDLTNRKFDKLLRSVNKDAKRFANALTSYFSDELFKKIFSTRNGPWQSSSITKKQFKNAITI